jgi:chromosome segregation ATPase
MPRDATITQEQVNAAADAIRATGTKPTARAVREAVGGGSMATVLKLLQVWQSGQARTEESPIALPAGLQRALVDFIAQEVASAKVNLQADLVVAQQANNDLIAESERQASTIELQASALESAQAEKAELVGRLAQVESELARAVEDVAGERHAAEQARTELAKAQLRLEAMPILEAENERLRTALESERTLRTEAQRQAATADMKASGLAERLADVQVQLQEQKQHAATLESDKRRLEADVAAISKETRDSAAHLGKLEGLIAALQQQQATLHQTAEQAHTVSQNATEGSSTKTRDKAGDKSGNRHPNK